MRMLQTGTAALFSLAALLVAGASEAGEITVMSTVAVREPYVELVPIFQHSQAKNPAGAAALLKFLTSPDAARAIRKAGMEPGRDRRGAR